MNIAIVGDLHGHFALMYAILGHWQRESGRRISLILQVGDLGTFLPSSRLDHATTRFAADDPEELGFGEFGAGSPPPTLLDPRPPLVFIPGNHEDFELLADRAARAPVSSPTYPVAADGRIEALRSGRILTFSALGVTVRVGGISGAANLTRKKGRHDRCHLSEDEALALAAAGRDAFDILISHDGPDTIWPDATRSTGSPALRAVIEEVAPAFAFFGHHNRAGEWTAGRTRVIALADCGYDRDWRVDRDGIGILSWGDEPRFERLVADWLTSATRKSWKTWK